jgi:hypothetical protein
MDVGFASICTVPVMLGRRLLAAFFMDEKTAPKGGFDIGLAFLFFGLFDFFVVTLGHFHSHLGMLVDVPFWCGFVVLPIFGNFVHVHCVLLQNGFCTKSQTVASADIHFSARTSIILE